MPTDAIPAHLRAFDDYDATRNLIYDNTVEALRTKFPLTDNKLRLELVDVELDKRRDFSLTDQKKALMSGR